MMTATLQLTRTWAELPVEPGHHTLRVKRYWPLMLASLIKPDLWISLRRD